MGIPLNQWILPSGGVSLGGCAATRAKLYSLKHTDNKIVTLIQIDVKR